MHLSVCIDSICKNDVQIVIVDLVVKWWSKTYRWVCFFGDLRPPWGILMPISIFYFGYLSWTLWAYNIASRETVLSDGGTDVVGDCSKKKIADMPCGSPLVALKIYNIEMPSKVQATFLHMKSRKIDRSILLSYTKTTNFPSRVSQIWPISVWYSSCESIQL